MKSEYEVGGGGCHVSPYVVWGLLRTRTEYFSSDLPPRQQYQETLCGTNEIRTLEGLVAHFLQ
jgi:hypothetical protein